MTQQNKEETVFVAGLFFDLPSATAPDWVKGNISIKVPDLIPFLEKHKSNSGYVNINLKVAKSGKAYASLNTWKPSDKKVETTPEPLIDPIDGRDLSDSPF